MSRFSEAIASRLDSARVAAIRAEEAARIERQFAPSRRKAARNAEAFTQERKVGQWTPALS